MRGRALLLAAALALSACGSEPAPPDMKDPAAVAKAYVDAFNTRDLPRMLPLLDQVNFDAVKGALAGGPSSPEYQGIFTQEGVEALAREGGKIEGPRYDRRDAVFRIGKTSYGDAITVILAKSKEGDWKIAENATMPEREFLDLSDKAPPDRKPK